MKYSEQLAADYSKNREQYSETDIAFFSALNTVGVKDKEVVDIGCGDGKDARLVRDLGASGVLAVDINERMIELAKEKTPDKSGIKFAVVNGANIPAQDGSVDLVISNFVIHYFLSASQIFNEISRILKKDAHFVGTFNITLAQPGFEHLYNQEMPIRLGKEKDGIIVKNLIKSADEIKKAIADAGLSIVSEQELEHPNAVVDDSFVDKNNIQKKAVLMVLRKVD